MPVKWLLLSVSQHRMFKSRCKYVLTPMGMQATSSDHTTKKKNKQKGVLFNTGGTFLETCLAITFLRKVDLINTG